MSIDLQISLTTELALLGFPRKQPLHGYEIYRRLNETPELRAVWRMKQSRLYAILSRLEEDKLLHATLEPQDNRPPRKVFRLTVKGESTFNHWLTEPVRLPREMRLDFMLKLYFAMEEERPVVAELVRQQQEVCAHWLTLLQETVNSDSPYLNYVRQYRHAHIEAIENWLAVLAEQTSELD